MRFSVLFILALLLSSCSRKQEVESEQNEEKGKFEMYEMSEMSLIMEKMFADNKKLRPEILEAKELGRMPDYFQKIHMLP